MNPEVLVSGYVSLDRIIKIDRQPQVGKTSIVQNQTNSDIFFGGCSVNISYLLAKLSVAARPMLRVGSDYARSAFQNFLEGGRVDTSGIVVLEEDRTSNCFLLQSADGNHITLFYPGAQDKKHFAPLDPLPFSLAKLGVLTVGAEPDNAEFLERCQAAALPLVFGMKTDWEAFPAPLLKRILQYASIIFMNESEEADIVSLVGLKQITDLFELGQTKILIVTKGKKGSQFWEKTEEGIKTGQVIAVEPKQLVDTTGSGDAYMSGFIYGYLHNYTTSDACLLGSTMSSFILEQMGCTSNAPVLEQLLERFKENRHE